MEHLLWQKCLDHLQDEIPEQQFNTWIRPLQADMDGDNLQLLAPNRFVLDWINDRFVQRIQEILSKVCDHRPPSLQLRIGSTNKTTHINTGLNPAKAQLRTSTQAEQLVVDYHRPFAKYTFENFVAGKSNQLAHAAAEQVGANPGGGYNPLFIYGGVGLGKTHLMHAIGNQILAKNPRARVVYLHSERFVADMVKALQHNAIDDFKKYYRTANTLLIDDIQFFAGKERSQEEFFHTFNALIDAGQQVVLTCDRYPKELDGLEERLKSRFNWGLTVAIEPPELETRVAILMSKAEQSQIELPNEVAFFIAKRVQSNVRELEGALKRVLANAHFTGQDITLDFTRTALKDLLAVQAKLVSIDNIQKTVADYFKVKVADLLSQRRTRYITRARQMAMALAKELTNHSLPEIGNAFGGRDHTTVLHACRKVKELMGTDAEFKEDYTNLIRTLST